MGAQFITVTLPIGENELQFDIWDTAGQERFRSLGALYYKTAKGALVVFDITAEKSFQRAKEWISELHQNAEPDILISLVGNKIDLESERKVSREVRSVYSGSPDIRNLSRLALLRSQCYEWSWSQRSVCRDQ